MKQLILDTRHITPTGDKKRPVVVHPTLASRLLNSFFAAVLVLVAIVRLCDHDQAHTFHFYLELAILALGAVVFVRNAARGEHPEDSLDADEYTNLQQYALYIWKIRLQNCCLCLAYIGFCLGDVSTLLVYAGLAFLALLFLAKWYFNQQIKQAAHLTPDLQLGPRVEVTLGLSDLARKLELATLCSMVLAIGVALWVGLSSYIGGHYAGMWIWSAALVFSAVGVTFSLRKMMRQPISLADQAEADEVMRDRWIIPLVGLCLNLLCTTGLVLAYLFI